MPVSDCDLHLHTHYSDGRASPSEVLQLAASRGLKTVAITDHDNLNAAEEAEQVSAILGLELVPGIELTSRWENCGKSFNQNAPELDVDVLGYFFERRDPCLLEFVAAAFDDLRQRIGRCCDLLAAAGYPLNIQDVLQENPRYPGAMQLISALWHKDYASGWDDAFSIFARYWPQVQPGRFTVQEVIAAIHAAGGVAILAHPISISCDGEMLGEEKVARLAEYGLDGLEIYHPRMAAAARRHFASLAERFGLLASGGSDDHGWFSDYARMGSEPVTSTMIEKLRERARLYP